MLHNSVAFLAVAVVSIRCWIHILLKSCFVGYFHNKVDSFYTVMSDHYSPWAD